nr:AIPR family protein [Serratia proteamaculans]
MSTWKESFDSRADLKDFGDNGLALFALALRFGIDDLDTVAAEAITDGHDDKKCDLVYVNPEEEYAVIAQCYFSSKNKQEAPANKASDLNIALAWLLQRDIVDVPDRIRSAAQEIRGYIRSNEIKTIYVWYVHNLPQSKNVENELVTVQQTAKTILTNDFLKDKIQVVASEIGDECLTDWYNESLSPILVDEIFTLDVDGGYEVSGNGWHSLCTLIPAKFLYRVYKKHKIKLFSANIRDYLGSRSSDSNINNGIRKTAETNPKDFWVYNNGVTALVHSFKYEKEKNKLEIRGLSIVNGAQTTGAIGSLSRSPSDEAKVQIRFVSANEGDNDLIQNIIQYNNSQNKVEASDFRSTDKIQKRLKEEFRQLANVEYDGGRRGGFESVIKRRANLLPSYTVGQALMSFHGDPISAYNQRSGIWINDKLYSKIFNENTHASHIICVYSLMRAVENKKKSLISKANLQQQESLQLEYFRKRGSIPLFCSAISYCLETFLSKKVPNLFRVSFGDKTSPAEAEIIWSKIIDVVLPFCTHLQPVLEDGGLKNATKVNQVLTTFSQLVLATSAMNTPIYTEFSTKIHPT